MTSNMRETEKMHIHVAFLVAMLLYSFPENPTMLAHVDLKE